MDTDFAHNPKYIPQLINRIHKADVVIGSRYLKTKSTPDWPLFRIWLTFSRHLAIRFLLSIPYDSSGAFRCINCQKVPLSDLILAKDDGYSYFWESIFILHKKKYRIEQIPVQLPYRKIGSSKMNMKDIFFSIYYLMIVFLKKILGKYNFK